MQTTVVVLSSADAEEILALQTEAYANQLEGQTRLPLLAQSAEDIAADLADKRMLGLGLRDDQGHLAAAVRVYIGSATAQVGRLCVLPTMQGIGLATDLVSELERHVPAHVCELRIFTDETAAHARQFYANLGYTETRQEAMEAGFQIVELTKKVSA